MIPKANVLGIRISLGSPDEIIRAIRLRIDGQPGPASSVVAVNAHTFSTARRHADYRRALNAAHIAFIDGTPVRWILRAAGHEAPTRIHGHDLMLRCFRDLPGVRHLFFGSTPSVQEDLRRRMATNHPDVRTAGFISPPFRRTAVRESPDLVDQINGCGADILWLALGAPKQEFWARINADQIRVPIIGCVGAAFEILAGRQTRAPRLLQHSGLEWAWRLGQDPWRLWRRYLTTNAAFLASCLRVWSRPGRTT